MKTCCTILCFTVAPLLGLAQQPNAIAVRQFEAGENAYNAGRYDDALQYFTRCTQTDPGYYPAYTARAAVKERQGNWPGAISDYSIYLERFPMHTDALFSRGVARYRAAQYQLAVDDLTLLLTLSPQQEETKAVYYRQSAFGGGTDRIVTTQGAIRDQVYNYLGLSALHLHHHSTAIAYFDSALALAPGEADYYVHRGLARQEAGDARGAEADYRLALTVDADHPLALHNLGVLMKDSGGNEAEALFDRAIEKYPALSYSYLERGYFRMNHGNLAGALSDYNKAVELDGDAPDAWVNRGLVKEKLRDLPGAYQDFSKAIDLKYDFEKAWFCRGNVLAKMSKLQEAVEDYTVAITYHPQYAAAYYNRAVALHRLGQQAQACDDVHRAEGAGMQVNVRFRNAVCGLLK